MSTASASRALAREGAVSADLRRRVLAAAERLGYAPNLAARSLAARRSGMVGIMVNTLAEPPVAELIAALERRLAQAGFGVAIATSRESPGESLRALRQLIGLGVEAVALAEPAHGGELVAALRARGLPWAGLGEGIARADLALDDGRRRGAELACRYLLSLGHRRIGVLAPTAATAAGVSDALGDGQAAHGAREAHDLGRVEAGMRELLEADDPPTAVICGSDLHALVAVRVCLRRGIGVPQAVSVTGFGDAYFARHAVPALTTVRVAADALVERLADGLLRDLGQGAPSPAAETPLKLILRESTAAAALGRRP